MTEERRRVLVMDDEVGYRDLLRWELGRRGFAVEVAGDGAEGVSRAAERTYSIAIVDLTMPKLDGLGVLAELKKSKPLTKVILVTGFSTVETAVEAMRAGAFDFILKPFDLGRFIERVLEAADIVPTGEG